MNDSDYKQLITWGLRRQLTSAVLILTFLSASIQLFSMIGEYYWSVWLWGVSSSDMLSFWIIALHVLFFVGVLISVNRFFQLYEKVHEWEAKLESETLQKEIKETYGWYHSLILSKSGRIIIYLSIVVVWFLSFISKLAVEGFIPA